MKTKFFISLLSFLLIIGIAWGQEYDDMYGISPVKNSKTTKIKNQQRQNTNQNFVQNHKLRAGIPRAQFNTPDIWVSPQGTYFGATTSLGSGWANNPYPNSSNFWRRFSHSTWGNNYQNNFYGGGFYDPYDPFGGNYYSGFWNPHARWNSGWNVGWNSWNGWNVSYNWGWGSGWGNSRWGWGNRRNSWCPPNYRYGNYYGGWGNTYVDNRTYYSGVNGRNVQRGSRSNRSGISGGSRTGSGGRTGGKVEGYKPRTRGSVANGSTTNSNGSNSGTYRRGSSRSNGNSGGRIDNGGRVNERYTSNRSSQRTRTNTNTNSNSNRNSNYGNSS